MKAKEAKVLMMAIGNRFFSTFPNLKYRGIEVARYLFFEFINHLYLAGYDLGEILKAAPGLKPAAKSEVFSLVDSDYSYIVRPGKKILNCGQYIVLPAERQAVLYSWEPVSDQAAMEQLLQTAEIELEQCRTDFIFGSRQFRTWFQEWLLRTVAEIDKYTAVFEHEEIGCVVAPFAFSAVGRAVLWLAKSRGIVSVAYQPSLLIGCNERSDDWPITELPIVATFKTVWGQKFKEFFMGFGVPPSRLPVIGNPHFDRINSYQAMSKADFRQKYGIPDSHKIILQPTEYKAAGFLKRVKLAVDAINVLPETTLLIKIRDSYYPEEREIYKNLIQGHPRIMLLDAYQSIYDLIANSDVVLVWFSTCGVEAMLFGKPVVVINVRQKEPPCSYMEFGAPEVHNSAELTGLLQKLFTNPEYERAIRAGIAALLPDLCIPDGKAIPRMTEFILKVADGEYRLQ